MRGMCLFLALFFCAVMQVQASYNLLSEGDFNTPDVWTNHWTVWSEGGWVNQETITHASGLVGVYDGTLQISMGNAGSGARGIYQVVSGSPGDEYTLSIQAGAQDWWKPNGSVYLQFLDADNNYLDVDNNYLNDGGDNRYDVEIDTTASINSPDLYDVGSRIKNLRLRPPHQLVRHKSELS